MALAVSVNGKLVFCRGFCYSDLENQIFTKSSSIMKVAGATNPLVVTVLAKLWEEGKIDLDSNLSKYVPNWQEMLDMDKEEEMTVRQLLSWVLGIRQDTSKKEDQETSDFDQSKAANIFTLLAQVIENATGEYKYKYLPFI